MTTSSLLREEVVSLLRQGDFARLVDLAGRERAVVKLLLQYLYDPRDPVQWRAVEGLGRVAGAYPGQVQKVIGRLLYLLNEDSGSFGWLAAAALGEIGRNQLAVIQDIIPMFCGFLEEDFSRAPMLWGVGRMAEVHPEELAEVRPWVQECLSAPDPQVRTLAAWCLGKLADHESRGALTALLADEQPVTIYDQGELRSLTVAQAARGALSRLDAAPDETLDRVPGR